MKRAVFKQLRRVGLNGAGYIAVGVLAASLFCWRLVALLPGLAGNEVALPTVKATLKTIWNQPLDLPLLLSRLVVAGLSPFTGIGLSRLPSVLFGIATVVGLFWLLKRWYGTRLASFGIVLVMTSPWLLHAGRLATDTILYPFLVVTLLILTVFWHQKQQPRWLLEATIIAATLCLYIPGALWLLAGCAALDPVAIKRGFEEQSPKRLAICAAIALILLVPLIHGLIFDWHLALQLVGIPSLLVTPIIFLKGIVVTWRDIFVGGLHYPLYNLAKLPLLDTFTAVSSLLGVYLYFRHGNSARGRQLLFIWVAGTLLIALQGEVQLALLFPVIIVLATAGLGYILQQWLKVFPRNPLARSFGIGLMILVVACAAIYNVRNYFIAWPNAPETRAIILVKHL